MMPMDDGAMNDAALEQALGAGPGMGAPPAPGAGECPLCAGPVDPETGMTLAPPELPMAPMDPTGMPPGMV